MLHKGKLVSVASVAAIAAASPLHAQSTVAATPNTQANQSSQAAAAQTSSGGLADIVVTARRVEENLQKVPVAVTVLSGAQLQQQSARQVPDVALTTPSLTVQVNDASPTSSNFAIRGQVQPDALATQDPSVGIYVDEFYWARVYGINASLLDIKSVQVLKGPQGTLFGRNTTGGAILIGTNDPSFSEGYSVLASGTYGRYDYRAGSVIVNAPLVDDVLSARVAFQINKRDGYQTELNSGRKLGGLNDYTIRGKLLFHPVENFRIVLSGEQFRTNFLATGYQADYYAPSSPANIEAGVEASGGACFAGGVAACFGQGIGALSAARGEQSNPETTRLNRLPRAYAKTNTYTGIATLDTPWGALKAIGGYRQVRALSDIDLDGTGYNILASELTQNLKQYSVEVQATGKALNDTIDFAGGVFVFREYGTDSSTSNALPALNPVTSLFFGRINTHSMGVYGQATWHASDKLSLTGGLRYSADDKDLVSNNLSYNVVSFGGIPASAIGTCQVIANPTVGQPCPTTPRSASFDGISYTASVDYKFTPDILVYIKTAKGFRSGGQNLRGTELFAGSTSAFQPEKATSYEGGIKSEFFNRHLRVNASGYYTIDRGVQGQTTVFNSSGQSATYIANIGRLDIWGGEIEADAVLPAGFLLGATLAHTNYKYVDFIDPNTGFDRSRQRNLATPEWKFSVSPSWSHQFHFARFGMRGDFSYESSAATLGNNYFINSNGQAVDAITGAVTPLADEQAFKKASTDVAHLLVNARASLTLNNGLDIAVWGRNLSNVRDRVASLVVSQLGFASSIRREPRTIGVTATFKFQAK
jgi:iron complex outermembrane recepter protein